MHTIFTCLFLTPSLTPPPVGPCFRRGLISRGDYLDQNQTGLPADPNSKQAPAWLGDAMRRCHATTKKRYSFIGACMPGGAASQNSKITPFSFISRRFAAMLEQAELWLILLGPGGPSNAKGPAKSHRKSTGILEIRAFGVILAIHPPPRAP